MKLATWIGVFLTVALLSFLLGDRYPRMSATEARAKIEALEDAPGFQLVQTKRWEVSAVLGSRIEKKLRSLLHVSARETPGVIEDYHFRAPPGSFCVQLLDREGEKALITVYGAPEASNGDGELLRATFPDAEFSPRTTGADQNAEQDGTGQPATRPESKSEGGDKPQPRSEGRSR